MSEDKAAIAAAIKAKKKAKKLAKKRKATGDAEEKKVVELEPSAVEPVEKKAKKEKKEKKEKKSKKEKKEKKTKKDKKDATTTDEDVSSSSTPKSGVTLLLFYQYVEPMWSAARHKEALKHIQSVGEEVREMDVKKRNKTILQLTRLFRPTAELSRGSYEVCS